MRIVSIELKVKVPDVPHTDEQLEEWLKFELGVAPHMSADNPLDGDIDPLPFSFDWRDS